MTIFRLAGRLALQFSNGPSTTPHLFSSQYPRTCLEFKGQKAVERRSDRTDGRHKILTFTVDDTNELNKEDTALAPPVDAIPFVTTDRPSSPEQGLLVKKFPPVYPPAAKVSHLSGIVILDAMIGDGWQGERYARTDHSIATTDVSVEG